MLPVWPIIDHDYYIVELQNVMLPDELFEWLETNCGKSGKDSWFLKHPNLYFAKSRDHLMFVLKWS